MNEGDPPALIPLPAAPELPPAAAPAADAVVGGQSNQRPDLPPVRPAEPDAADCCGEGCVRCVYDRYDAAVERYQLALGEWQARHPDPG